MAHNYVVIGSEGVSVASSQTGIAHSQSKCPRGHVTATPLSVAQLNQLRLSQEQAAASIKATPSVKKVLLKAVNREKAKECKIFTLRNIKQNDITSCKNLKSLIKSQLCGDIIDGSFDVGVMQNNSAVSFRSAEDLTEIWEQLLVGKSITLWCDGMTSSRNKKRSCDELEEESEKRKSKKRKKDTTREEQVEELIEGLKVKHGTAYTPMQFRIWAEMIAGGVHVSHDEPPSTTMFNRSGSINVKKKTTSDVVTQVVDKIANVLSPKAASSSNSNSPAKVIENRSKCYKQLSELKNLNESGVLSDEEYLSEKEAIMSSLKKMR